MVDGWELIVIVWNKLFYNASFFIWNILIDGSA